MFEAMDMFTLNLMNHSSWTDIPSLETWLQLPLITATCRHPGFDFSLSMKLATLGDFFCRVSGSSNALHIKDRRDCL